MAIKKYFTDESLESFVGKIKEYTDEAVSTKADVSHTHDDRYYTETEIDSKVSTLNTAINGKADNSHTHTIANVDNLQTTLDGKSNVEHNHDGRYARVTDDMTNMGTYYGMAISRHGDTVGAYHSDNYYMVLDSGNTFKVGTQLNGATEVTWNKYYNESEVNNLLSGKLDKTEHNKIYSRYYDNMSTKGWYRIAKYDGMNNVNNANGAGANSCEIKLQSGYANLSCSTHHIQLLSRYYNSKFQSIFDYGAYALFSKIRHVVDNVNNIAYIDVYYDYEKYNGVAVEIIDGQSVYPDMWWEALAYYPVSETNDNEAVMCVYELGKDTTLINSGNIGSQHVNSASYLIAPSVGGITCDEYGNFKAKDTSAACWNVFSNDGTSRFSVYFDGSGAKVGSNEVIHTGNIGSYIPTKTSQLTNDSGFKTTDTTYSAGTGLSLSGTTFSLNSTNQTLLSEWDAVNDAIGAGSENTGLRLNIKSVNTATGSSALAANYYTIANRYQTAVGKYNKDTTASLIGGTDGSLFIVGNGTGASSRSNAFRTAATGQNYGLKTFAASGADYAEFFEYADGNPNDEDRRGLMVTLDGEKIRLANAGEKVVGIISADPSFIGDISSEEWHDRYLRDVFGAIITEQVEVPEQIDKETGDVIPAHTETRKVLNPDYNPDKEYISREYRKEWGMVGLIGKLVAIDDGTCEVGNYCTVGKNGIATLSNEKTQFYCMKRIDENHIRVFIGA